MKAGPTIKGNPLKISVYLLIFCYIIGEFIIPKYPMIYLINLIGIMGLIISLLIFFYGFNMFGSYKENPSPQSSTKNLIKTGIFSYTRNPIYLAFILFHFSMFLTFENVMYFLTSLGLFVWINTYVIKYEEDYLMKEFGEEYANYQQAVSKWFFL